MGTETTLIVKCYNFVRFPTLQMDILIIINKYLIFIKIYLIENHGYCIMLSMEVIPDEYKLQ